MRVFELGSDSEADIQVYVPGPPGPPLVSVGSFLLPIDVSGGTIAAPVYRLQRSYIKAVMAPVIQPAIPNPPDNDAWMIALQVVGTNSITLNNASNIKLASQWIGSSGSILWLLWDGNSQYIEDHRNGI